MAFALMKPATRRAPRNEDESERSLALQSKSALGVVVASFTAAEPDEVSYPDSIQVSR